MEVCGLEMVLLLVLSFGLGGLLNPFAHLTGQLGHNIPQTSELPLLVPLNLLDVNP